MEDKRVPLQPPIGLLCRWSAEIIIKIYAEFLAIRRQITILLSAQYYFHGLLFLEDRGSEGREKNKLLLQNS